MELSKNAVYVASTEELSGKSVLIISLALLAKEAELNVGYFKPIGEGQRFGNKGESIDEDVETMKKMLDIKFEHDIICPVTLSVREYLKNIRHDSALEKIKRSYDEISADKNFILIEGPHTLSTGAFLDCPVPRLAAVLGAKIILVVRFKDDSVIDDILQSVDYCTKWGAHILGIVLNKIPEGRMDYTEKIVKPFLEKKGIEVLGLMSENKYLGFLTIQEIYDAVGGKILAGKDGMSKVFETVLIGAMTPQSATAYFRKSKNELIITGGDRTDIIFAAFETGASALILTGNIYPSVKIFPRADDLLIPIIMVPYDTYTTLQLLQQVVGRIKPEDKRRIRTAKKNVKESVNWKKILQIN